MVIIHIYDIFIWEFQFTGVPPVPIHFYMGFPMKSRTIWGCLQSPISARRFKPLAPRPVASDSDTFGTSGGSGSMESYGEINIKIHQNHPKVGNTRNTWSKKFGVPLILFGIQ